VKKLIPVNIGVLETIQVRQQSTVSLFLKTFKTAAFRRKKMRQISNFMIF